MQHEQQHLYLVVDDWERGYSVRKVDVDDAFFDSDCSADLDETAEPLPEPPVVRFNGRLSYFGGHGTTILAMPVSSAADGAFPVFDIKTLELNLCAHPDGKKVQFKPFFASVAGELYMLNDSCLSVLDAPAPLRTIKNDEYVQWSWTTITSPSAPAPVRSSDVVSSALHPDGKTLFVSDWMSTFSLDTESLEWTWQGNWVMPFQGQAYYDDELDAWVGLCHHKGGIGYVCCCDVPPAVPKCGGSGTTMPAWKVGKEQLFYHADDDRKKERHLGATLVNFHLQNINDQN